MENKIGYAVITTGEYKELITKVNELDARNIALTLAEGRVLDLEEKLKRAEEEIKELLLTITDGNKSFNDGEVKFYNINGIKLANYITKNYIQEMVLKFRKMEEENND